MKAAPARPKARPRTASFISSSAFQSGSSVTAKVNFSSPKRPEVALAHSAAVAAGKSARCSSRPAVSTSMAKAVAAKGVLNRPAKPADMPVISIILGASSNLSSRPNTASTAPTAMPVGMAASMSMSVFFTSNTSQNKKADAPAHGNAARRSHQLKQSGSGLAAEGDLIPLL